MSTTTVADIVAENPAAARVFERAGIDYCCHGERSLVDACAVAGADAAAVADEVAATVSGGDTSWRELPLAELAAHIVEQHHRYLWDELPMVEALAGQVADVHGERHPELPRVRQLVTELRTDLEPHLAKEERVLFPAIEAAATGQREFPFGSIANPIRVMTTEHDAAGDILSELRDLTGGYVVPDDGCASYRSLYERLELLELDTHLHIHKENHTLFPAALGLVDP